MTDVIPGLSAQQFYATGQQAGALPTVALSIRQPWAWLIVQGHKDIENRTWRKVFPDTFLVHAGQRWDLDAHNMLLAGRHPVTGADIDPGMHAAYVTWSGAHEETGGFVGVCGFSDCVEETDSEWFVGPYGYVVKDARPLPFLPWRGMLGFFKAEVGA